MRPNAGRRWPWIGQHPRAIAHLRLARRLLSYRGMLMTNPEFPSSFSAAAYLWQYFHADHSPGESESRAWHRIKCATSVIRKCEPLLDDNWPPSVRVKYAKRVRRAAGEVVRLTLDELETLPDIRVAKALGRIEGYALRILDEYGDAVKALQVC